MTTKIKTEYTVRPWGIPLDVFSTDETIRNASRCAMRTFAKHIELTDKKLSETILLDIARFDKEERDARLKGASQQQKDTNQGVREAILFMLHTADLSFKSLSTTLKHLREYRHIGDDYLRVTLFKLKEEKMVKFNSEEGLWQLDQCVLHV